MNRSPITSDNSVARVTPDASLLKRWLHGQARLSAVVLLQGRPENSGLEASAGRSLLDLPVSASPTTILDLWEEHLAPLAAATTGPLDLRLILSHDATLPSAPRTPLLRIERDPSDFRGTGGLLRDIAGSYPDDSFLLVASASTILLEPLVTLIDELLGVDADVCFFVHDDGSSPNLTLIRTGCLRTIKADGFVDFKEQALPSIAQTNSVSIVRRGTPVAAGARTASDYLRALRSYHVRGCPPERRSASPLAGAFAENWESAFSIVEAGARIGVGASILDSVILSGATVGRNATVVRSIVCRGVSIPPNAMIIDGVIAPRTAPSKGKPSKAKA